MKAGAGVLIVGLFAALPAVAWQTAPNTVPGAAPAQPETASSATPSDTPAAKPCSAASIRAATAEKVAPALTGCNLALVAPPLLQFFHLVPTTTQAADKALPGTILSQKPAAGAALSPGGHLALAVSNGKPEQTPPAEASSSSAGSTGGASSSASSTASSPPPAPSAAATSSVMSPAVEAGPADAADTIPTSMPLASPPEPPAPQPPPPPAGFPLWGYIAVAVAVLAALGAAWGLRARSATSGAAAATINCDLDFGPGRLKADGPLVEGPAIEVAVTAETEAPPPSDITVLAEDLKE